MADGGAGAFAFARIETRAYLVEPARGQAKSGHVKQRLRRLFAARIGQRRRLGSGGPGGELFGDGCAGCGKIDSAHGK